MQNRHGNIEGLDTLRAIAAIGVITIHISTPVVKMAYGGNMAYWWIGNVMDSAVRFAVPVFLMLSGATMLGKEYGVWEFYKKRILRVLVPFLFWMLVYWIFRWTSLQADQQPKEFHAIIKWAVNLFLSEGISKHFWYVYMILFLYLFVPLLGKGLRKLPFPVILYLLFGWIILTFSLRNVPANFYCWSNHYWAKLLGYSQFSGYLVLGFYLSKLNVMTNKLRGFAGLFFVLTIALSAVGTYLLSKHAHVLNLDLYGNTSLNTILQSTAIFLLIKDSHIHNQYLLPIQRGISSYSYGIYLSHIMIIGIFFQHGIFWTMAYPLVSLPLILLLTLLTSMLVIFILRKMPYGKYISG
jgi:surface polysaccharide O-acyltransferase-like enzyme